MTQPSFLVKVSRILLGAPRNLQSADTRQHLALTAFLAWVGLGADGLSSSAYGPEEAFLALGQHGQLGLYLAIATALTVFIIAVSYNQVIELFPSGGGGYKVATTLIGPRAGLLSGSALIIDYVLTIAISVAACVDALYSVLPIGLQPYKLPLELALVLLLMTLNLRGMKESVKVLLPLFIGFLLSHFLLIGYGIAAHGGRLPQLIPQTLQETGSMSGQFGSIFVIALLLKAYSLGGGTYTGLEAVSNNVNTLAEPRVRTGRLTMLYMALSLSFTAAGIIILYLLWDAQHVAGMTLNAVVFQSVLQDVGLGAGSLTMVLLLEAGLLLVAANTGFLGGPAVLSNMAVDGWMPRQFRRLSSRLVTQNGIVLFGLAALVILLASHGQVALLVVLYSINVFITFSLSLYGLCVYWWRNRQQKKALRRLALSMVGFLVTISILLVTVVEKFAEGGWVTMLITGLVVLLGYAIKQHYLMAERELRVIDKRLAETVPPLPEALPFRPDQDARTAVVMVGSKGRGTAMHTLLWIHRIFPNVFSHFVFVSVGEVDVERLAAEDGIERLHARMEDNLGQLVAYCQHRGWPAQYAFAFSADRVRELTDMAERLRSEYPNCVFFASQLMFDTWWARILHHQSAFALQDELLERGMQMVILPMKLSTIRTASSDLCSERKQQAADLLAGATVALEPSS
ncbi:amino acid permease [Permianibacter sp. IMCC34836]|uniref:APC family permease n=1 Tax=Permianibacter fluminis TaxID=2738515 RepID=UPI001554B7C1|nr:APC family permease [Permianibacter fluminis]NQD38972.1 amino acid permease [Permianibacter fluminis]